MPIEITLKLERGDLVIGESTPLAIVISNATDTAQTLIDPDRSDEWPKIRVRDLQSNEEKLFGPHDLEKINSHEFTAPRPVALITLQPRQSFTKNAELLRWVMLPHAGEYELSAIMKWSGGEAVSKPVRLTLRPLALQSIDFAGPHSGPGAPFRYWVWSQASGSNESAIILSLASISGEGGVADLTQSRRVADVGQIARPTLSVTPNKFPYPAEWIVWSADNALSGLYVKQGKVETPIYSHPLNTTGAVVIGPVILDLIGSDGSRPGRGHVALWRSGSLSIKTFEPDGKLSDGPQFNLVAGNLVWGRAAALVGDAERRYVLAVQRGNQAQFDLVRWGSAAPQPPPATFADWTGRLLGAGMMLNAEDTLIGAAISQDRTPAGQAVYQLHRWRVEAKGATTLEPPIEIKLHASVVIERAIVELSPQGKILALLQTADKRWCWCDGSGVCFLLPPAQIAQYGESVGGYWLDESTPLLVVAAAQTGIAYRPLPMMKR